MPIIPCQRNTFTDPLHGEISVDHDPLSGAIFIEFERFEADDLIMPQYRISLSTEHVAAWVEWLLTNRHGRQCRRVDDGCGSSKRLQAMLRLTEKDANLVFCMPKGPHVILIRNGRVLKVTFQTAISMSEFSSKLREEDKSNTSTAREFVTYVYGLMLT